MSLVWQCKAGAGDDDAGEEQGDSSVGAALQQEA